MQINFKPCLAFLLLALALVIMLAGEASSSKVHELRFHDDGVVGDFIGDENELLMDSEANRRTLAGRRRYISYEALRANQVPCGRRGRSYYNCQQRGRANPYHRACTAATHCARNLN